MILNKSRLEPAMVDATVQAMHRIERGRDGSPIYRMSRFGSVVDARGYECGAVTKGYRLLRNADLVAAVDLASDKLGIDLEAGSARYHRGRSRFTFYLPNDYRVPGDPSGIRPQLTMGNGYGGSNMLDGLAGVFRLVCTNGLIIGNKVAASRSKHTRNLDVMGQVEELLTAMVRRAEDYMTIAQLTAEVTFDFRLDAALDEAARRDDETNAKLIAEILGDTPKKYQEPLIQEIGNYQDQLGHNAWAVLQAIADVSTHEMGTTWSSGDWNQRQANRVLTALDLAV